MKTKFQLALQLVFVAGATLLLVCAAYSQFLTLGVSGGADNSTPTTPCVGGQLDFSDATGCNTTLYMVVLSR